MNTKTISACLVLLTISAGLFQCTTRDGILSSGEPGKGLVIVREKNNLNAKIFLDHKPSGKTTAEGSLEDVPVGSHVIHILLEKYRAVPDSMEFILTEAGLELEFELRQTPFGGLRAASEPAGAVITLNGLELGVSPASGSFLELAGIPAGTHILGCRYGNYRSSRSLQITSGRTTETNEKLSLEKFILAEHFSNTSCDGCPEVSHYLDSTLDARHSASLISIEYHPNFPSADDPMYLAVPGDNEKLMDYYGFDALPAVYLNGALVDWGLVYEKVIPAVNKRLDTIMGNPGDYNLIISTDGPGSGRVTVHAADSPISNLRLRVSLLQEKVVFPQPPGSNLQSEFHNVYRGSYPDAGGIAVNLDRGGTFVQPFDFDISGYGSAPLRVIAYLQEDVTRQVVQVNMSAL